MRSSLVSLVLFVVAVPAQSTIVSPTVAATSEGPANNVYPFSSAIVRRYQQIHGDLGAAKALKSLSFRLNAGTGNNTAVWTIDLEMFMGANLGVLASSQFFDRNYFLPRTGVIARKTINWGPPGQATSPGPVPFSPGLMLTLDAPFVHVGGTFALVWEVVIYANTVTSSAVMDADVGSTTTTVPAITGAGCSVIGRPSVMTHNSTLADIGGILAWNFTVTNGPSGTPVFLALGTANPNLSVPGLCSALLTDMAVVLPIGVTDATGALTTHNSGASTFILRNTLQGGTVYSQVHALDAGQPNLPFANSNGRAAMVPSSNLTRVCDFMRVFNDLGGTTAIEGNFFQTLSVCYGLVTQFTY